MKHLTSNQIRNLWLDFFKTKKHKVIDSANLIPVSDKTLLWINSGVAALKQYFDGSKVSSDRRLVNAQKSIRTNDIENVGKTNRHHTFFEMLGNFSIGDYFRDEAIAWGFEFLTLPEWLGLDINKLYFTYHPTDTRTRDLWIKCGALPDHVIANADNFWEIGEGPCGPNTEIFFDLGEAFDPLHLGPNMLSEDVDNDRFLEIWNIVFSQYNAKAGVKRADYKELPSKNIDTGAGLERIASVMQEVPSNFETDLFMPIIKEIEVLTNYKYEPNKMAFRVIADHIRTATFALSDGASFSNEGRGYVLRRVIRRAIRFGKKLNQENPFLYKLVPTVITIMGEFYPYLKTKEALVSRQIKAEEERFLKTLTNGEELLRNELKNGSFITGEVAFKLYDTFGFPLEITLEIASEVGATVDVATFNTLLQDQKDKARSARKSEKSMASQSEALLNFKTPSIFVDTLGVVQASVIGLFKDGLAVSEADTDVLAVFDMTTFYAESGGQISDTGQVYNEHMHAEVIGMSKAPHGQSLHHLHLGYGTLKLGDKVNLALNTKKRRAITLNHSATHLLHRALNDILGPEVSQAGSYVGDDYLRFDFNYNARISETELLAIEEKVNFYVSEALPLVIKFMSVDDAKKLGAKALFMEKYGDLVRVVIFGSISVELCGGTHVANTSEIGSFVITSEGSVAGGIRRIVALSGTTAYEHLKEYQYKIKQISDTLNIKETSALLPTVANLVTTNELLLKEKEAQKVVELHTLALTLVPQKVNKLDVFVASFENKSREDLGVISDKIRSVNSQAIMVFVSETKESSPLLISISKEITSKVSAQSIMKVLTKELGATGGGRPDFVSGVFKTKVALTTLSDLVKKAING